MDANTARGIALALFGVGVIVANIVAYYVEKRRSLSFKRIRKERRGFHDQ